MRATCAMLVGLLASLATAAPPTLTAPPEVKGDVSAFVVVKATAAGAKWVKYVPLDSGLSVFPSDLLADKTVTVVVAAKAGRYRVLAYTGTDEGGAEAVTVLVIGDGGTKPTDPPVKPIDPPPAPGTKQHFMIVRANGPIQPAVEAAMNLPAWAEVKAAGHTYADLPFDSLTDDAKAKVTQTLPAVLVWNYTADGKRIQLGEKPAVKMPTTDTEIRGLLR